MSIQQKVFDKCNKYNIEWLNWESYKDCNSICKFSDGTSTKAGRFILDNYFPESHKAKLKDQELRSLVSSIVEPKGFTVVFDNVLYYNNKCKVNLTCSQGHSWRTEIAVLSAGHGCHSCTMTGKIRTKESIEKGMKTCQERYGGNAPTCSKDIQKKVQETLKSNYNTTNPSHVPSIRRKAEVTTKERFGSECALHNSEVKEKAKLTNMQKYGTEYSCQADSVKEKIKMSNKSADEGVKSRIIATNLERFGCKAPLMNKDIQSKAKQTKMERDLVWTQESLVEFFKSHPEYNVVDAVLAPTYDLQSAFKDIDHGWWHARLTHVVNNKILHPERRKSKGGDIVPSELLHGIQYYNKSLGEKSSVRPDYVDFEHKLIIEADGLYWHFEKREGNNFKASHGVKKDYHYEKRLTYNTLGYKFLAFSEREINEKPEIVSSIIRNKLGKTENKVAARKCELKQLDIQTSNAFFESNHLMGKGSGKTYALMYEGEVVCALRFVQKDTEIHISRFACKNNTSVVGGYSRLLKQLRKFDKSIINFVDCRHGDGKHLEKYGFELVSSSIGFWWTDGYNYFNRRKFLGDSGYTQGFEKYWDYGQLKYVLNLNKPPQHS